MYPRYGYSTSSTFDRQPAQHSNFSPCCSLWRMPAPAWHGRTHRGNRAGWAARHTACLAQRGSRLARSSNMGVSFVSPVDLPSSWLAPYRPGSSIRSLRTGTSTSLAFQVGRLTRRQATHLASPPLLSQAPLETPPETRCQSYPPATSEKGQDCAGGVPSCRQRSVSCVPRSRFLTEALEPLQPSGFLRHQPDVL